MTATALSTDVFSYYNVAKAYFLFSDSTGITDTCEVKCISNLDVECEVKTISKNCGGISSTVATRGTGNGTVNATFHIPWALYTRVFGFVTSGLKDGIYGYGYASAHEEFALTAQYFDEHGNEKLGAWPCVIASAGPARKIENGADTVAEVEIEFSFSPDSNGIGMYDTDLTELDSTTKAAWLTGFTPALVKASTPGSPS